MVEKSISKDNGKLEIMADYMTGMGFVEIQPKSRQESAALAVACKIAERKDKKLFFKKLAGNELDKEQLDLFIEAFFSGLSDDSVVMIMESEADNNRKRNALEIAIYKATLERGE